MPSRFEVIEHHGHHRTEQRVQSSRQFLVDLQPMAPEDETFFGWRAPGFVPPLVGPTRRSVHEKDLPDVTLQKPCLVRSGADPAFEGPYVGGDGQPRQACFLVQLAQHSVYGIFARFEAPFGELHPGDWVLETEQLRPSVTGTDDAGAGFPGRDHRPTLLIRSSGPLF